MEKNDNTIIALSISISVHIDGQKSVSWSESDLFFEDEEGVGRAISKH